MSPKHSIYTSRYKLYAKVTEKRLTYQGILVLSLFSNFVVLRDKSMTNSLLGLKNLFQILKNFVVLNFVISRFV
jgi:hypothetical protein